MGGLQQYLSAILLTFGSLSYGFVLLTGSVSAGTSSSRNDLFHNGHSWSYTLESNLLLNTINSTYAKNVGYQIQSRVQVSTIWTQPDNELVKLFKLEVISPKLFIKSRKAPEPDGFVQHASDLDTISNQPIYISWNSGVINKIYVPQTESQSLLNFKKGVASLFQFQLLDGEAKENDVTGTCTVAYTSIDPHSFSKTKLSCQNIEPVIKHPNPVLSTSVSSQRQATYQLNVDNNRIDSIITQEVHETHVNVYPGAGNNLHTIQKLTFVKENTGAKINGNNIQIVLQRLESETGMKLVEDTLLSKQEISLHVQELISFPKAVKEHKEWLKGDKLGSAKSTSAFVKLVNIARQTKRDDLVKVLKHARNKDVLLQLLDVVGFTQTDEAHEAVKKVLRFDDETEIDYPERYLWALSMGSHPTHNVLIDILKLSQDDERVKNVKLHTTILLTLGALGKHYRLNPQNVNNLQIVKKIKESLVNGLEFCRGNEECILRYTQALQNLQEPSTIPILLQNALTASRKISIASMKALRTFPQSELSSEVVQKGCKQIFYMRSKLYDSSTRTLALDTILEANPSRQTLKHLIHFLTSNDKSYEVKQYLIQRLSMLSSSNLTLKQTIKEIIQSESVLNNYNVLGQRGLSTAFSRDFARNGSLVTIQEINSGIVKRGIIDVVLQDQQLFRLGLFAGGLNSFVSSSSNQDPDPTIDLEEPANGGMELSVLGVQIRPFLFFSGQGELMGHVWSGTASEKTPAYQALLLLHDHHEVIRLSTGVVATYKMIGSASFDLSGQIQMSLWNRNAQSEVTKNAGIVLNGVLRADTSFVQSQVEFTLNLEPRLSLASDIDFSSNIALCMKLQQPDTILRYNVYKVERIPNSKHKLRKSVYKTLRTPGKTYALNQKNNEMCSGIQKNK